ncbi:9759_t:CDS:2, partial [Cetraspora pellucida]
YEQNEPLTARIRNIINNADDAGSRKFYLIADDRSFNTRSPDTSLLTPEMDLWQGPALWVYNDSEFTEKDFKSLRNLGRSEKSKDNTKIGRFGIGLNCCYNISDVISFVSGEYITFLDPSQKWLPKTGNPPRKPRGLRINFIEKDFKKRYSDQAKPYMNIEGCDFSKRFNGTLFRIPLRTRSLAVQSEISDKAPSLRELVDIFSRIQGSHEMLFLRNIESCGLHFIYQNPDQGRKVFWESKIENLTDLIREQRLLLSSESRLFQLEIETNRLRGLTANSEIWLICSGGTDIVANFDLESFSLKNKLLPRGGVASLLAQSDEPLERLKSKPFPNPPQLRGRMYSYLSLPIPTGLNVHLNGTFALSSDRKSLLQYDSDFMLLETPENKWNEYILFNVLPPLHAKLLEQIALLDHKRFLQSPKKQFEPITSTILWPIVRETNHIFVDYGKKLMQQLERGDHKIFWTLANGGMFTSHKDAYFAVPKLKNIANVLATLNIPTIKLTENQMSDLMKSLPMTKTITVQLICNVFYESPNVWDSFDQPHNLVINLLKFIFQNGDETVMNFRGLALVPLLDGTVGIFGHQNYYISSLHMRNLFKNVEKSKFVAELPPELDTIFKDEAFGHVNGIKFLDLDASAVLDLLEYELPCNQEICLNPSEDTHPNQQWIDQILAIFMFENSQYDFLEFSKFPLLPMEWPEKKLVLFNPYDPLLYLSPNLYEYGPMIPILSKLGVRFTCKPPPQNSGLNPNLAIIRECILLSTPTNMVESLQRAVSKSSKTLDQVFLDLNSEEIEKFRNFIRNVSKFNLGALPIWSTHSQKDNFISARSGVLLPMDTPFFPFQQTANIFSVTSDEDYNMFVLLGTKQIEIFEYIKEHLSPHLTNIAPNKQFVDFLTKVLSLRDSKIETYLKSIPIIPNRSLTKLYKAEDLYSENEDLFRTVFQSSDKFLPPDLQGDNNCLQGLERMGLNVYVNPQTFMACARKIHSDLQQPDTQFSIMRSRAKTVINYLYEHLMDLIFTPQQWKELIRIKFVPAETDFRSPYNDHAMKTTGFESLNSLCCQEYKHLCWTKCPLFEATVDPPKNFLEEYPKLGKPLFPQIIDNWRYVALDIFQSNTAAASWRSDDVLAILKEIYAYLNNMLKSDNDENKNNINYLRKFLNINEPSKLFLNSNDPFDSEKWLAGQHLVFGIKEDILPGLYKVHPFLEEYKELLKIAGAKELKAVESNVNVRKHSQKDELIKELLNSFEMQNETKHHDVVFCIYNDDRIEKVYANRYVLSASSNYFRAIFGGQMIESTESQRVTVEINDILPYTFRVLIRWLYGQSFEDATSNMFETSEDQSSEHSSDSEASCLTFLIDLLKASDIYQVDPLKDIIEEKIITKSYVNVNNVVEILKWAQECSAPQLAKYCEKYIELNRELIIQKRKDNINNAENEEDRQLEKEMLNCLYQKY